jgi:alpha,alpha-trehalase
MNPFMRKLVLIGLLCAWTLPISVGAQTQPQAFPPPPSEEFGQLFVDVQLQHIFPDSKTFPDLVPNEDPDAILADYATSKSQPGFDLAAFVSQHFTAPAGGPVIMPATSGEPVQTYIAGLWDLLRQQAENPPPYSSLLPLPYPYVVPGGRFTEVYYWDSYFTMLGLEQDGRHDIALGMLNDFASEIDRYGHVPNGNRTYYLSRSQPPFFSVMVELIAQRDGDKTYVTYLPELEKEYQYWMDGAASLDKGQAYRHVVRLEDGTVLNRYWDDRPVPRDESYREDVATAEDSGRPPEDVYRNLRAAAESGWDFSSRWLADGQNLATIRTVSQIPVDLNSLMFHLEQTLSRASLANNDHLKAAEYGLRAALRKAAIQRLLWDEQEGVFTDYLWQEQQSTRTVTAASLFPLFFSVATLYQAQAVAQTVQRAMPGGLATTTVETGQQWDQPNGWAPLQWVAVVGLNNYKEENLARTIAERWVSNNIGLYEMSGKLVEKYNVLVANGGGSGGEYALQIGFGWTNGVLLGLLARYPDLAVSTAQEAAVAQ